MSSLIWKSFNLCFSKFQCFPTISFSPPPPSAADEHDRDHKSPAANNPTLIKNFNSVYDATYSSEFSTSKSGTFSSSSTATTTTTAAVAATEEDFVSSSTDDSDSDCIPDFTTAFASHRFFFSSPGTSNSIFEPPLPQDPSGAVVGGGVAVLTYSPDPYSDFRESMLEMIEARDVTNVKADWEFLNELLLCYLTLNPLHTHKFIVGAFADVVVSLVSPPQPTPSIDGCRNTVLRRHGAKSHLST